MQWTEDWFLEFSAYLADVVIYFHLHINALNQFKWFSTKTWKQKCIDLRFICLFYFKVISLLNIQNLQYNIRDLFMAKLAASWYILAY